MEAWLLKIGGGSVTLPDQVHLVPRAGGELHPMAMPVVGVGDALLFVDGEVTDPIDALRAQGARYLGVAQPPWVLAVDAASSWDQVATLVSAAADAGHDDVALVFGRKVTESAPPASAISPELDRIGALGAGERPMAMVGAINTVFGSCKPILKAFGEAAAQPPEGKHAWLAHKVATGLGACGCTSDMASVRSLGWTLWGPGYGQPVSSVPITFTTAADGVEVALPANTPWKEAAERVIAAAADGKAVRAVVK